MSILNTHRGEVAQAIRNNRFELAEDGRVYLPRAKVFLGGALTVVDGRDGHAQSIDANMLTLEGLTDIGNTYFVPDGGYPQKAALYYMPYKNEYTPDGSEKGSTIAAAAGEFTAYTSTTRLKMTIAAAATTPVFGSTANSTLVFSAGGPYDIHGLAIVTAQAKGATTGKCVAVIPLASPRLGFLGGDNIGFGYQLTAADAG